MRILFVLVLCVVFICAGIGYSETYHGTTDGTAFSDYGVKGEATATTIGSKARGVVGITKSRKGIGVLGQAKRRRGKKYGVKGVTKSTTAGTAGVYGLAAKTTGATYGVYGKTNSANGYPGYFENTGVGLKIPYTTEDPTGTTPENGTIIIYYGGDLFWLYVYMNDQWTRVRLSAVEL